MTTQSNSRKISNFLAATSVPSGAYFTYISSGTNYKILDSNFYSSLGVTGTITQSGSPTGTPVLNKSGSVNNIRTLEDGSGVKTSVSPENGIIIEHDFLEDTAGVTLVTDLTAKQPKFRSLVAGAGVNISASNGEIQVSLSAIPASTKTVIVNSISDFPSASGGIITLADNTEYAIRNDISTTNRFIVGNDTVIGGSDAAVVALTYTGSGVMFTSSNSTWKAKDIAINCTAGTFVSFSGSSAEIFQLGRCVINAATLGTISGFRGIHFDDTQMVATTNGFAFSGSNGVGLFEANLSTMSAGFLYDLGAATFDALSFTDAFVTLNGSSGFLAGAAGSANITAGNLGVVQDCRFFGTGSPLTTITADDVRWVFSSNDAIVDTHKDCLMYQSSNTTSTSIVTAGVPVKLGGAWTNHHSSHFTTDATGKMTYTGTRDKHIDVSMSFTGEPVSGSNKNIGYFFAKNGVAILPSKALANISSGDPKRVTVIWKEDLTEGDYVEAFVENNTDTIDVLVTDAVMRLG